jgi:hypothetical protein
MKSSEPRLYYEDDGRARMRLSIGAALVGSLLAANMVSVIATLLVM